MPAPPSHADDARRFERHLVPILDAAYGTAVHLTRNAHDAEDLVQEAAFLAFRAFHQFEEGTRFKAWYFRILTNLFYQRMRKKKREPATVEFDDAPALYMFDRSHQAGLAAHEADPADFIMSKLTTEQVSRAIAALPEEYRVVAALYFMEDFGYQEIADIVDCPLGTVRSRLHRGRRALQRSLWSIAEECGIVPAAHKEDNG
ncbi:MAG: sigma-70 family RNA polymerase sigma factor [Candidatus Eisenbacteria bacterium]